MERLRPPDYACGAFGLLLLVSLFLPWYSVGPFDVTATEAFGLIDIWLLVTGAAGVAVPLITMTRDTPAVPVAADVLTFWASVLALLLVLFRVVSVPGPDGIDIGVDRAWGLWLGLIAVVALLASTFRAMRDQSAPGLRPNPEPELKPAP